MFLSGPYNIGHDHEVFEVVGRQIVHMKYSANNCLQYIYFIVLGFLILRDFEISLDCIFPIFSLLYIRAITIFWKILGPSVWVVIGLKRS